ncbi:hypothetical protein SAMN03080615_01951 [Amphritea atlantica]|uniref:Uncharacterized protein n=1 Tax=Amphritea atlantica TaxID=355243 RepID=A0A1H9H5B1_9GAMM|nr:hypothetical protein [Amphritea atlantica]SEQ57551.1 hypothetical protein SAMN03080615_01951 [Amphritea atlantica]
MADLDDQQVSAVMDLYKAGNEAFGSGFPEDNDRARQNVKDGLYAYDDTGMDNVVNIGMDKLYDLEEGGLPRSYAPAWECIRSMHHGQNGEINTFPSPSTGHRRSDR